MKEGKLDFVTTRKAFPDVFHVFSGLLGLLAAPIFRSGSNGVLASGASTESLKV